MSCKEKEINRISEVLCKFRNYLKSNKTILQLFGINFVLLLIFFGGLAHNQYNADTVFYRYQDTQAAINVRMEEGRYMLALMDWVLLLWGINVAKRISITVFCNLFLFCITLCIMYYLLTEEQKIDWCALICTDLVFLNVFATEFFMFGESLFGFAFGYLLATLAVKAFCKKRYVLFFLALCIGTAFYQYAVIFAAILLLFAVGNQENWILNRLSLGASMGGSAACLAIGFLNMVSTKVLAWMGFISKEGVMQEQQISLKLLDKLQSVGADLYGVFRDARGLMIGKYIPFFVSVITIGLFVYYLVKKSNRNRIAYEVLINIGCFVLWITMPMIRATYENPPRMAFSFFLIQGLFMAHVYQSIRKEKENLSLILKIVVVLYLLAQLLSVQNIVNNRYMSKAIDEIYVKLMYQKILDYEAETGIQVTKLASCNDASGSDSYEDVGAATDSINEKVLGKATWSIACDITSRMFELAPMDSDIWQEHFAGKDWDYFNLDEQLVIRGDTVYWCIF